MSKIKGSITLNNIIVSPYLLSQGSKLVTDWNSYRVVNSEELNSFLLNKRENVTPNSNGSVIKTIAGAGSVGGLQAVSTQGYY